MKNEKISKLNSVLQPRRNRRFFSEEARKAIVKELENGQMTKAEAARKYKVSPPSIYNWIKKYSDKYKPPIITIAEHESDSKKNKLLEAELTKAYELLGRLQAEKMFLEKIVVLADQHYETDLKKNFASMHLLTSLDSQKND